MNTETKQVRLTKAGTPDRRCRNNLTPEQRSRIGRAGGHALVFKNGTPHMAVIGRKGGRIISRNRKHMARIGRIGGRESAALSNLF